MVGTTAGAGADMDRLAPAGSPAADTVAQIGAGCAAVRRAVAGVPVAEMVAVFGWWRAAGQDATGDHRPAVNITPHL
jgi:hypothetical protein